MKVKKTIFLFLAICLNLSAQPATILVKHTEPLKYEKRDGKLKILSYIKLTKSSKSKLNATLNGAELKLISTTSPDSLLVWLPLVGDRSELKLYAGNQKLIANQILTPLIAMDWGYFQNGIIHIIQSSHQDIAWMDTPDYCKNERIHDIILPALQMMKEDSTFTFEMEQTLNLMEFLDAYPEKKSEVIQRYKEKRFYWGATFNQPYEGLQSGEQLVRQVYFGRKWMRENLPGCDDITANNMDVPGRNFQFPQILAKSGIKNLMVSRMREGLYNWFSPDGSSIVTFSPGNYGWASMIWKFFDNDAVTAFNKLHHRSVLWSDYYRKHNIPPHYAILLSCDATKPISYKKIIDEWNKIAELSEIPLPRLKSSTAEEFLESVSTKESKFETVQGERPNLWLYIHGPAHYQAHLAKREAGILLPAAESFSTFNGLLKNNLNEYSKNIFDRAWLASIYPDHGLGGKNGHITDSIFQDSLQIGRNIGNQLLKNALNSITEQVNTPKGSILVYNDLTWMRTDMVVFDVEPEVAKTIVIKDSEGNILPTQLMKIGDTLKVAFIAKNIPSMGYKSYSVSRCKLKGKMSTPITQSANYYENNFYRIIFGDGGIESMFDKTLNKELLITSKFKAGDVLDLGYTGNGAGEFTQIKQLVAGDITPLSNLKAEWNIVSTGAIFTDYQTNQQTKNAKIIQRIRVYHTLKKIDFDISLVDFNGTHNRQYRMAIPLNMNLKQYKVQYEVPMGIIEVGKDEMKTIPGGWSWEGTYSQAQSEIHPREIQNFISASGNGIGITMSSCVAVADWLDPSREMSDYPVLQGILLSSHKSCHSEGNWYEQKGTHHYSFSVTSHPEGWQNGYQFGLAANHPLIAVSKKNDAGSLEKEKSFMKVSNPFVLVSALKRADNDNNVIIRLTEMKGEKTDVTIEFQKAVKKVIKTNMIEDEVEIIETSGKVITLPIGSHAIETYKIIF
jgi:alpha-mannosidase